MTQAPHNSAYGASRHLLLAALLVGWTFCVQGLFGQNSNAETLVFSTTSVKHRESKGQSTERLNYAILKLPVSAIDKIQAAGNNLRLCHAAHLENMDRVAQVLWLQGQKPAEHLPLGVHFETLHDSITNQDYWLITHNGPPSTDSISFVAFCDDPHSRLPRIGDTYKVLTGICGESHRVRTPEELDDVGTNKDGVLRTYFFCAPDQLMGRSVKDLVLSALKSTFDPNGLLGGTN